MLKAILKWLAGVFAVFILLFAMVFIFFMVITDDEPVVVDNSYLHISLSGGLSEYQTPDPLEKALGRSALDIKKVRDVLEKATVDERINGVLLEIELLQTGYAKIQELRHLIENFRKSGKPIYAFLGPDFAFTRDYYVASACDSIFMPPATNLFLTGVGSEITFYKDFLKKIGVEADFVQIGAYKNAPEIYTQNKMTDPHRHVLSNILDSFYGDVVSTIALSRDISEQQVKKLINEISGFTGKDAMDAGLVDGTAYIPGIIQQFSTDSTEKPVRLSATAYADVPASSLKIRNKSRIAVINCVGAIAGGSDSEDPYYGKIMGAKTVVKSLERAAESKSIKAIILRIDSPGGSATASEEIWHAIQRARQKKPVIASIADYGASGGYYISMAADTMITTANSLVGSIGIYAGKFSVAGLYDLLDLKNETLKIGRNASLFSLKQKWSSSERALITRLITDYYQDFLQKTADSRGLSAEQVDALGQGHVWTGQEAVDNNLFDSAGFFYDAVNAAKTMTGIDSLESVRLVYYPREKSLFSEIFSTFSKMTSPSNPLSQLETILLNMQNKPLAMLPFKIYWN